MILPTTSDPSNDRSKSSNGPPSSVGVPDVRPISILPGCLYLVGTPIGNLGDLSPRAAAVMAGVDRIVAEDTRRTLRLLNALAITKPLISYHEHNLIKRGPELIGRLLAGESLALVTDAGMPCISDPGADLVRLCVENEIPLVVVPGPTAAMTALAASGLLTDRFAFDGFLPTEGKDRRLRLASLADEPRTMILYEAPHRLRKTLSALNDQGFGERKISIARELTKRYETILRFTVSEAVHYYKEQEPKGEYVLILEGLDAFRKRCPNESTDAVKYAPDCEILRSLLENGLSVGEAAREAAKRTGQKRNVLYEQALIMKQEQPAEEPTEPSS